MTYKIKSGDTLSGIANAYNTTVDALAAANGIKDKNLIYAGNTLTIPDKNPTVASSGGTSSASGSDTVTKTGGGSLPVTAVRVGGGNSAETDKAAADIARWRTSRPSAYKDSYAGGISSLLSYLAGRKFSYDPKSDPSYTLMRDKYLSDARLAMEDAAGDAAAKTGGYSNSYAGAVGNLAYNRTMEDFAEILPELYEAAYDRYSDEGDSARERLKLLSTLSGEEWERYSDSIKNYLSEGKMLEDFYSDLSKEDTDNYLKYLSLMNK